MASKIPGSVQELLDVTCGCGRYHGAFQNGLRHGQGRIEFEVPSSCSSTTAPTPDIAANDQVPSSSSSAPPALEIAAQMEPHFMEVVWVDGQRHGRGIVHIAGHIRYEGDFQWDEANGQGKLVRWFQGDEQDVFEGEFRR